MDAVCIGRVNDLCSCEREKAEYRAYDSYPQCNTRDNIQCVFRRVIRFHNFVCGIIGVALRCAFFNSKNFVYVFFCHFIWIFCRVLGRIDR